MTDLHTLIAAEKAHIKGMTPDDCVEYARYTPPAADPLDAWLVKAGFGTVDVSDPEHTAWLLLHAACDRATEIVCMGVMECDEDGCWPQEEPYRRRVSKWGETLAELVTAPNPMVIARESQAIITGLNRHITEQGANHPAVLSAWRTVGKAVAEIYPSSTGKWQWKRMSALERTVVMSR